ncbi:hypothetical protein MPLB_160012 [Mesorhizobium sp. ORS 3324]|nr:hypothetical protein MPLB_160012 [Mesorhizobium sp. ORS 3324]
MFQPLRIIAIGRVVAAELAPEAFPTGSRSIPVVRQSGLRQPLRPQLPAVQADALKCRASPTARARRPLTEPSSRNPAQKVSRPSFSSGS